LSTQNHLFHLLTSQPPTIMRSFLAAFASLGLAFALFSFQNPKPKRVIFFGDSITQAGVQPGGYIRRIPEKLPQPTAFELIGAGIGGNKVYDLYLRLEEDVLAKKPDIVVLYVGVNDVWHKSSHGTGTDPDKFEKFYLALIQKIQKAGIQVICCTPAVIGEKTDHTNPQDGDLNAYSQSIRRMAKATRCKLIDLRAGFLAYNREYNPENLEKGILTTDRVHLNDKGNDLVAAEMAKALVQ